MTTITASDVAAALSAAGIAFEVKHASSLNEQFVSVRQFDGRAVAFANAEDGVDVAYHTAGTDSDVRTRDRITILAEVTDLVAFLSAR